MKNNYVKISSRDFNIEQIANSGQCFRIYEVSPGNWKIIAFEKALTISYDGATEYILECSVDEYQKIWRDYFDLQRDYGVIKENIRATGDPYLIAAVNYGYGIRILHQDLWETIVTFIISQRNNIPRIRKIISKLCDGEKFPSPKLLATYSETDFLAIGLGYRAKYLVDISRAAVSGKLSFDNLKKMNYIEVIDSLKKFNGIGNKVANCIALYGLHKLEAFPIDIWMKRIINKRYFGNFDPYRFAEYAGIVQQYMFFYERHLALEKSA